MNYGQGRTRKAPVLREICRARSEALRKGFDWSSRLTREEAMRQMAELFKSCFAVGVNPLRALRQNMPGYNWQHHNMDHLSDKDMDAWRERVKQAVHRADIMWLVDLSLITAVSVNRTKPSTLIQPFFWMVSHSALTKYVIEEIVAVGVIIASSDMMPTGIMIPAQPFCVGDKVIAKEPPVKTPTWSVSHGTGRVDDERSRKVATIWVLVDEWYLTLEGVPGMFVAKDFILAAGKSTRHKFWTNGKPNVVEALRQDRNALRKNRPI